jgi:uncharacterized protein YfiM (DUF2279 family)
MTILQEARLDRPTTLRAIRWRILFTLCSSLFGFSASADDTPPSFPQIWLNAGVYSYHFDTEKDLRNNNIGFGAEFALTNDHELLAGTYINSNDGRTRYAAYQWRPLHWDLAGVHIGGGIVLGAFDGYPNYHDGGWFVAPLPVLSIEGRWLGANISLIPTVKDRFDGALAIQLKLRVW